MNEWTKEIPTPNEPLSHWWFCGWPFGRMYKDTLTEKPYLMLVECSKTDTQHCFISNGHFMYESEFIGMWKKFEGFETPSLKTLQKLTPPEVKKNKSIRL